MMECIHSLVWPFPRVCAHTGWSVLSLFLMMCIATGSHG
jgi:hypothetical protein